MKELVTTSARLAEIISRLLSLRVTRVAVDTETQGLRPFHGDRIIGVSFAIPGHSWYVPVRHEPYAGVVPQNVPDAIEILRPLLESLDVEKVFHNAMFDTRFFLVEGVRCANVHCTLVAASVDDERRLSFATGGDGLSLNALGMELLGRDKGPAEERLAAWCREHGAALLGLSSHAAAGWRRARGKWKMAIRWAPLDQVCDYATEDVELPLEILDKLNPPRVYEEVERPLMPVLLAMEAEAKWLDLGYLERLSGELRLWEEAAVAEAVALGANPHAAGQIVDVLFRQGKAPVQGWTAAARKGGPKVPSTDKMSMLLLRDRFALAHYVLEARKARKYRTTYTEKWLDTADALGRIWPGFPQHTAQTGRLSSRDPSLHQTPRGPLIRSAIIPPPGEAMILADWAQIEPRFMAHFGNETRLIEAFKAGKDVYGQMAVSGLFPALAGTDPEAVKSQHPLLRTTTKTGTLAVTYGAKGLKIRKILLEQADVDLSVAECEAFEKRVWRTLPGVAQFVRSITRHARERGIIENPWGRRRHVGPKTGGCKATDAFNTIIQGTAADLMKRAMVRTAEAIRGTGARMCMTIHDEIVLHCPTEAVRDVVPLVRRAMEDGWPFRVPIKAEISVATKNMGTKVEIRA